LNDVLLVEVIAMFSNSFVNPELHRLLQIVKGELNDK